MTPYRRAWTMRLKDGAEAAYDTAHASVWPELLAHMQKIGVQQFFLFRSETTVYAFQVRDTPFPNDTHTPNDVTRKWWEKMSPLMETDSDGRPVHYPLTEVFAFDPQETNQ